MQKAGEIYLSFPAVLYAMTAGEFIVERQKQEVQNDENDQALQDKKNHADYF